MLHSAKLPKSYWGLVVKHATMLRNVSPSSALSGTTPFECVYAYKPNLATLRKFGSRAYVNTPKDQRKKWDNKVRVGIYVGEHEQSKTHLIYMCNELNCALAHTKVQVYGMTDRIYIFVTLYCDCCDCHCIFF